MDGGVEHKPREPLLYAVSCRKVPCAYGRRDNPQVLSQLTVLRYVGHWEPKELDGKCSARLAQVEAVCSRFVKQGMPACGCESHEMLYVGGASSRLIPLVLPEERNDSIAGASCLDCWLHREVDLQC